MILLPVMCPPCINVIRQIISWIAFHRVIQLQSWRLELGVHLSVHLNPRSHFDLGELSPHFAFKSSFSIYSIVVVMSTLWKSNCNWNIRFSNQRKRWELLRGGAGDERVCFMPAWVMGNDHGHSGTTTSTLWKPRRASGPLLLLLSTEATWKSTEPKPKWWNYCCTTALTRISNKAS